MNTTTAKQIELAPATEYRRDTYGVMLTSATVHMFTGTRVHNPHHTHTLDVWDNSVRTIVGEHPDCGADCQGPTYVDPSGQNTTERYSYVFNPNATVLSAHPGTPTPYGAELSIGDTVELTLHGVVIATIVIAAKSLDNPHGVRV